MSRQARQRLKMEKFGEMTVVHFVDKRILDKPNIEEIGDQLFQLVDDLGRTKLLVDFSNVEYLSSAALGKLITLDKKIQAAGGWLVLCNVEAKIHEVFRTARLDKILQIHEKGESDPEANLAQLLAELKSRPRTRPSKS
jgi:anti-sigma B factor antagonist